MRRWPTVVARRADDASWRSQPHAHSTPAPSRRNPPRFPDGFQGGNEVWPGARADFAVGSRGRRGDSPLLLAAELDAMPFGVRRRIVSRFCVVPVNVSHPVCATFLRLGQSADGRPAEPIRRTRRQRGLRCDLRLAGGYYVRPTALTEVTPNMRVAREEIFGPVVSVIRLHTEEEAVHIANGTDFGPVPAYLAATSNAHCGSATPSAAASSSSTITTGPPWA